MRHIFLMCLFDLVSLPNIFAFWSCPMINVAACFFQPRDSTVIVSLPFGIMVSPL